jgi:hypothetical protein
LLTLLRVRSEAGCGPNSGQFSPLRLPAW